MMVIMLLAIIISTPTTPTILQQHQQFTNNNNNNSVPVLSGNNDVDQGVSSTGNNVVALTGTNKTSVGNCAETPRCSRSTHHSIGGCKT
jgi:hypothetical protein